MLIKKVRYAHLKLVNESNVLGRSTTEKMEMEMERPVPMKTEQVWNLSY
jgi:hypothetical protein